MEKSAAFGKLVMGNKSLMYFYASLLNFDQIICHIRPLKILIGLSLLLIIQIFRLFMTSTKLSSKFINTPINAEIISKEITCCYFLSVTLYNGHTSLSDRNCTGFAHPFISWDAKAWQKWTNLSKTASSTLSLFLLTNWCIDNTSAFRIGSVAGDLNVLHRVKVLCLAVTEQNELQSLKFKHEVWF